MNFYIDKMILWLKDGTIRTLQFEKDKINIITGNSKTGKTAVLEIIDYCLCGGPDTVVISDEHIGENVLWYGIRFGINEKVYTIARGAISKDKGLFSKQYYFSQTGEIPPIPFAKFEDENRLKLILEKEFSIDDKLTVAVGGKSIKKNTRLSFRYFLMFSTLSKDIIDNGKAFFDKLNIERYRDVWPQIFDLSMGVIDAESIALQKKINDLRQDINSLDSKIRKKEKDDLQVNLQKEKLVKMAKENQLLDEAIDEEDAFLQLQNMINSGMQNFLYKFPDGQRYEALQQRYQELSIELVKLKRFKKKYSDYKKSLQRDEDSLKPIEYIRGNFSQNISGEYLQFLEMLERNLYIVKNAIKGKQPFEYDVERKINELEKKMQEISEDIHRSPQIKYAPKSIEEKLVAFGEIKALYRNTDFTKSGNDNLQKELDRKNTELQMLEEMYAEVPERRELVINTLNEYIQMYVNCAKEALDDYGEYCAWFDYKKQQLYLKKNKTAIVAKISSSSDHLFLHLCLFAGMHHMILDGNAPYIPSFLIMDQPSRPYFNNNSTFDYKDSQKMVSKKDDWSKVEAIFKLWDQFFELNLEQEKHFQAIILEHVEENAWKDCKHVHLIEIFDGITNALVPLKLDTKRVLGIESTDKNMIEENKD